MVREIIEDGTHTCPDCHGDRVIRTKGKQYCLDCGTEWVRVKEIKGPKRRPGTNFKF